MAENESVQPEPPTESVQDEAMVGGAVADDADWFLAIQVEFAERGIEQDIVLDVGGSHLAGTMIGGWRYFDLLAAPFRKDGVDSTGIAALYEDYRDAYDSPEPRDEYPGLGERQIGFIHLRDAKWLTAAGPSLPNNGTLWRGKLSAVDGFWIGTLSTSAD